MSFIKDVLSSVYKIIIIFYQCSSKPDHQRQCRTFRQKGGRVKGGVSSFLDCSGCPFRPPDADAIKRSESWRTSIYNSAASNGHGTEVVVVNVQIKKTKIIKARSELEESELHI